MEVQAVLHAPQVVMTVLILIGMGVSIARYGEQKRDKYDIFDVLVSPALVFGLLWWGGFYG